MFSRRMQILTAVLAGFMLLIGCAAASAASPHLSATLPTAALTTATLPPSPLPPTMTPLPPATIAPAATQVEYHFCQPETMVLPGHFLLSRPIAASANPTVDITYRYGTTSNGAYQVHHGVDLHNPKGTNVYAAADGVVVVAGRDSNWGAFPNFYGNLVIVSHDLPEVGQPLYTLYGHLSQVEVLEGDKIKRGDKLGEVGATGVAIGSHLHFEVRLGENSYRSTRNPELWMMPPEGADTGVLAAYIIHEAGYDLEALELRLRYLYNAKEPPKTSIQYPFQYRGVDIHPDDEFGEQFAVGDLPAGTYELAFTYGHVYKRQVQIEAGKLTLAAFCLGR